MLFNICIVSTEGNLKKFQFRTVIAVFAAFFVLYTYISKFYGRIFIFEYHIIGNKLHEPRILKQKTIIITILLFFSSRQRKANITNLYGYTKRNRFE